MAGGIISGFLDKAGNAASKYALMQLETNLTSEREDANFLRDKVLKKSDREFTTSERVAGQEFTASENKQKRKSAKEIANIKQKNKNKKGNLTNNIKNANDLIKRGYPRDVANAVAQGAFKQIQDKDSEDVVLVNTLTSKEVGRLTTIGNKKKWLPTGEQPENAEISSKNRREAKLTAKDKASYVFTDGDFPSTGGNRKEWERNEAQRLANEEREGKSKGIIGSQIKQETKMVGKKRISKDDYIKAMVKKHGKDGKTLKQIERQWLEYSAGN